ncbi:MAG: NAD(P)/FAD-dependent oxidoreductase [Thermoplasmatales archaeon]|nr:MAG: NAD(P)/FAD-dependent oxidoreductase [Thermoplasmatales archaeon]
MKNFHVAIIGGGVIGSAIAWELSKYKLDVVVFEKGLDVCSGTSKANSGVIHSGINSTPGTLKARFCVEGNKMFTDLAEKLGFSLKWTGKYVIAKNPLESQEIDRLIKVGKKNNVLGLEIHTGAVVKKRESNLSCFEALWVPTAGVILPYEFTIVLAENAVKNNVNFLLETKVTNIKKYEKGFKIETNKGVFSSNILINSGGLSCREIVSMVEKPDFKVYPCRGEYLVLDKNYSNLINSMIYPVPPAKLGVLGVHITPTIEGNILIGPSAEFIDDPDDKKTTLHMMKTLLKEAKEIIPSIPENAIISAYSGIRCKLLSPQQSGIADYRIEESKRTPGLINLLGIESPGLTSAPAIAKEVTKLISKFYNLEFKKDFKIIKKQPRFSNLKENQQFNLIKKDEKYGRIICRCEQITEAEVIKALSNLLHARSISSVQYRCRAGMGRCQGGFCTQHLLRIMQEKFGMKIDEIKMKSPDSYLFTGYNRELKK